MVPEKNASFLSFDGKFAIVRRINAQISIDRPFSAARQSSVVARLGQDRRYEMNLGIFRIRKHPSSFPVIEDAWAAEDGIKIYFCGLWFIIFPSHNIKKA